MTIYQQKVLANAYKVARIETGDRTIEEVLLHAIEERDKLLQELYHYFGPAHKTAERIAKVLDIP